MTPASRLPRSIPSLLLFLSGATALVYQVLWVKQLSLVVGVDAQAIAAAVGGFFLGLASGGVVWGRQAERTARPWRLFSRLEAGVALLGVGTTLALAHSAGLFAALERGAGAAAWAIPIVAVAVPACLMGGTVPVLLRAVSPTPDAIGRTGGALYAANTAGAIAGTLAAPFVLIPAYGVRGTAVAAALVNLAAAALALVHDRRVTSPAARAAESLAPATARAAHPTASGKDHASLALALYAVAGAIALGYEVIWSHVVVQFVSTRAFAFAIMLAMYLTGLVIGSAVYARFADGVRRRWLAFGVLIALAGLLSLLLVSVAGPWLMTLQSDLEDAVRGWTANETAAMCARFAVAASGIVLLPSVLLGAAFPAALRLSANANHIGRDTGRVLAFNTVGGIAGTLVTGFALLPSLGTMRTLGLLAVAAGAVGAIATLKGRAADDGLAKATSRWQMVPLAIAVMSGVLAAMTPVDHLARLLTVNRGGGTLRFYAESPGGTVAVVERQTRQHSFRQLYIQGVSNSGDTMGSLRYMRLQALLPLIVHPGEPKSALVIGLGTGITAGALLQYPGLERRVCAELLPAVVKAAPLFAGNYAASTDGRLDLRLHDGRRELVASDERYDLITLEPPPPSAAGVVNLYSRDFYQLARTRLAPDGVLAQWWPLPTQRTEDSRALVRAFLDAFPYASVWTTELHEMLLLGSTSPLALDAARLSARFAQPTVSESLAEVGIASPEALLATWIGGRAQLDHFAGAASAVTDDRPAIEYASWVRPLEILRVLPTLLESSTFPSVAGADAVFLARVAAERARLHLFYTAGLAAYRRDQAAAQQAMRRVLSEDGGNPYYRWFMVGGSRH